MFDGENWNLMMKDELINKIYDDKKNYIEENIDDSQPPYLHREKKHWIDGLPPMTTMKDYSG